MKTLLALALTTATTLAQGPLLPPAAPAPSMKSLAQIEACTPISASPAVPIAGPHFTITQPGSYYLTGNIEVLSGDGIQINSSNVTLDLNGFALLSITVDNPSVGSAILLGAGVSGIEIKNGRITGGGVRTSTGLGPWQATFTKKGWYAGVTDKFATPSNGVILTQLTIERCEYGVLLNGKAAILSHLIATSNSVSGLSAVQASIAHSTASNNGTYGIYTFQGSVTHAIATGNGFAGIFTQQGHVAHSSGITNGGYGMDVLQGSITNSTAIGNNDTGIYAAQGSAVNCRATGNANNGIQVDLGVAAHCVASGNDPDAVASDYQIKVNTGGQRSFCVPATEAGSP